MPLVRRDVIRKRRFEERVLWIFGSPRSGSTWLLKLLGEHPRVVAINEPLIGWFLGPLISELPGVDPEGLDIDTFTLRRLQKTKRSQFFSEQFKDVWLPRLRELITDRLYAEASVHPHATRLAKNVVAVKEPHGSQSADVILEALPQSRLLFLLRDGRDVVDSELAASQGGSWVTSESGAFRGVPESERMSFIVATAHKWLWRTEVVQEAFRNHSGPRLLLRYEELLVHTDAKLTELFDWLGLEISDESLKELTQRHSFDSLPKDSTGPLKFHRAASPGLWQQSFSAKEQAAVARIIGPKLHELGYEP